MMQKIILALLFVALGSGVASAEDGAVLHERRARAAAEFSDGVLLLHANSNFNWSGDGFRQTGLFYYYTGLENTVGAILAIDGRSKESWLFLPAVQIFEKNGVLPEVKAGDEAAKRLGMEHVVDWSELDGFLARIGTGGRLYFEADPFKQAELPENFLKAKKSRAPGWLQLIVARYPALETKDASDRVEALLAVPSPEGVEALRKAAQSTMAALRTGMRKIRPGVRQRSVEAAVENACWLAGAHGVSFYPWSMSGAEGVFPQPFYSIARYDHQDQVMKSGDLVRLDVGCEWAHYEGDLGRTVPVSGHYSEEQRETWNLFVAAYHAGERALKAGATEDSVYEAWRAELVSHRESAKSGLAKRAIELWSERKNVPYWQIHLTNLTFGLAMVPFVAGTTVNFEPIASIDGQGYFLEDMFLIQKDGAEKLTPGLPYTAEEIEAAMR